MSRWPRLNGVVCLSVLLPMVLGAGCVDAGLEDTVTVFDNPLEDSTLASEDTNMPGEPTPAQAGDDDTEPWTSPTPGVGDDDDAQAEATGTPAESGDDDTVGAATPLPGDDDTEEGETAAPGDDDTQEETPPGGDDDTLLETPSPGAGSSPTPADEETPDPGPDGTPTPVTWDTPGSTPQPTPQPTPFATPTPSPLPEATPTPGPTPEPTPSPLDVDDDQDGFTENGGDCDDTDPTTHPGADELCDLGGDPTDHNCDGDLESGAIDAGTWYVDVDGDGYGDSSLSTTACDQPEGYVADDGDCDDGNDGVHPGADELCDALDRNCDGDATAGAVDVSSWYVDQDADGYGVAADPLVACEQPVGHAAQDGDCDDQDGAVNPAATEICDGIDNNCDGQVDEGQDDDNDGLTHICDNCPDLANADQADFNNDGIGDVCQDTDSDNVDDAMELEEGTDPELPDSDGDAAGDAYDPAPLDPDLGGPILYLDFDQTLKGFDGEEPTVAEGLEYVAGVQGEAGRFDGEDDLHYLAANNFDPNQGTLGFWVKTSWQGGLDPIFTRGFFAYGDPGMTFFNFTYGWAGTPTIAVQCYAPPDGPNDWNDGVGFDASGWEAERWYHLILTWDDGFYVYYVDGQEVGNETFYAMSTGWSRIGPGADHMQSPQSLDGDLEELKIFDYVMTDLEASYLALEAL